MDGKDAWRDNIFVERLWKSVKYVEVHLRAYASASVARCPDRPISSELLPVRWTRGYRKLCGDVEPEAPVKLSVQELIASGETDTVEYKSTLRTNLHTGQIDEKMHLAVLKTLAGFLNAKGGTLMIGVADDGKVVGLGADGFVSEDKMALHLVNLIRDRIGDLFLPYIHPHFDEQDGERVMVVQCEAGPKAAFIKDGSTHRFFVRGMPRPSCSAILSRTM